MRKVGAWTGIGAVAIVLSVALVASTAVVAQSRSPVASAAKKKHHRHKCKHKRRCKRHPGATVKLNTSLSATGPALCNDNTPYTISGYLSPDSGGSKIELRGTYGYSNTPFDFSTTTASGGYWSFVYNAGDAFTRESMTFLFNGDATRNPSSTTFSCEAS